MTLSISDINTDRRKMVVCGTIYFAISLFCILFGAVYEYFSHDVYSYYMLYAFVIPLLGGVAPFFALSLSRWPVPGKFTQNTYHTGIATLTVGSIFSGVLKIYGTTNHLVYVYWIVGGVLLIVGILSYAFTVYRKKKGDTI